MDLAKPIEKKVDTAIKTSVTIAKGDGIGPEIMDATLNILKAAGARVEFEEIEIGEKVYLREVTSGIEDSAWDSLRKTKVFLKAPITTPQGGGYKSLNVTIRKTLGLFANVRPCKVYYPYVPSKHSKMDMVIIRENEEDLYAGIEHQQTNEVVQCLKLISRPGCEKIVRYAFEYARAFGRKKVTCMSKDNIMKHTDGLFHKVFDEIAPEYPEIATEHKIIDIGSALIADSPEMFDVVVTTNLYGDIISDIAAQVAGSVGLNGSSNVGEHCAMFEAIHGSAPDISGKNIANPSGLLNAAILMLVHIGQSDVAEKIENAWLKTLEDGVHTGDIYNENFSKQRVGTKEFADAVIARLGQQPTQLNKVQYKQNSTFDVSKLTRNKPKAEKSLLGVDVFIDWDENGRNPEVIGNELQISCPEGMKLKMVTNRGVKVFPDGKPETFCTDHWRCRFVSSKADVSNASNLKESIKFDQIVALLGKLNEDNFDVIKTENLYAFDGVRAYSLGQGE